MNVNDYEAPALPVDGWPGILRAVFGRQAELMETYREIEQLPAPPVSVHTAHGQKIIKDFAWRTTEELAESYEALDKHANDETRRSHAVEEIADALHFLVELLLFAGIAVEQCLDEVATWPPQTGVLEPAPRAYWAATYRLGIAMNFLRNKAWKKSQVPTDEARFRAALLDAFAAHVDLWATLGLGEADLFNFYFRKSEVNKFRQRSEY